MLDRGRGVGARVSLVGRRRTRGGAQRDQRGERGGSAASFTEAATGRGGHGTSTVIPDRVRLRSPSVLNRKFTGGIWL
ncbi:hypothetical protein NSERUTF1_1210 [Nocardia seriolae]|nr:hypothetical protein NSERUTF1_1210 [Nocardia seriolae]